MRNFAVKSKKETKRERERECKGGRRIRKTTAAVAAAATAATY